MTARRINLEVLRRWNDTFQSEGFERAERMIDQVFDPEVEFSPLLAREVEGRKLTAYGSRDEALRAAREARRA